MNDSFTDVSPDLPNNTIWAFKRTLQDQKVLDLELATEDENETEKEDYIICRACGNVIASPDEQMEVDGKFSHTFTNPAGIAYKIGCFSNAKGCVNFGEPTSDFTWFPGFDWCYALCSNCFSHLGWHYSSGDSSFFGLILDNIAENL